MRISDFNAKFGNEADENVMGAFGLSARNERGETLFRLWTDHTFMT